MALTYTPPGEKGFKMPSFELLGTDGKTHRSAEWSAKKATVVMFICNHCPYVNAIEDRLVELGKRWQDTDVAVIAICSNDPEEYPEDNLSAMTARAKEKKYSFPYLQDLKQDVAKAFGAVCTPDFFLFDAQQSLFYRGRLDDSWKDPSKVQRQELEEAIKACRKGASAPKPSPSMGCSIKWRE